jgi:hypothetical protein
VHFAVRFLRYGISPGVPRPTAAMTQPKPMTDIKMTDIKWVNVMIFQVGRIGNRK